MPSWRWLALAGLVGGGPTFLGTLVGYQTTSEPLELCFYALAGGAILYVIGEIWNGMRRLGHRELGLLVVSAGFMAMYLPRGIRSTPAPSAHAANSVGGSRGLAAVGVPGRRVTRPAA